MTFAADKAAIEARATTLLSQASSFLLALQNIANSEIVTGTTILPEQYDYASVPQINFPTMTATRPDLAGTLTFPGTPEAPTVGFSSVTAATLPIDDLLAPTALFTWAEQVYESTLIDPLKAKLLDNLVNGGYGIETADEIALFNRVRDREVEAMMSRVDDAGRAMAARGFSLPPGELAIHVDRAYQGMQDKVSDASRDIMNARTKLFVENRQFTITEIRQLETVLMNYWNALNERALNAAKYTAEFGVIVHNALIARYKARLDAAKITTEVNAQIVQIDVERARAAYEIFRSQIMGYEARLRSVIDPARLQVDIYRADIDVARMYNDASIAKANMQTAAITSTTQQNIQISQMTIENARARINGTIAELEFRTKAAQFGATNFFAQLSAVLSTINALTVETTTT